jgi:hypothetical protein
MLIIFKNATLNFQKNASDRQKVICRKKIAGDAVVFCAPAWGRGQNGDKILF